MRTERREVRSQGNCLQQKQEPQVKWRTDLKLKGKRKCLSADVGGTRHRTFNQATHRLRRAELSFSTLPHLQMPRLQAGLERACKPVSNSRETVKKLFILTIS